jgi:hypothetical protein
MNLPSTFDFSGVPGRQEEPLPVFDPKKYEQLLATAVLNKVNILATALRVETLTLYSSNRLWLRNPFFDYQFSHTCWELILSTPRKTLRRGKEKENRMKMVNRARQ